MKIKKEYKGWKTLLLALTLGMSLSMTVYGYWVDRVQVDCSISLKRNATILITGLTPPEPELLLEPEQSEPSETEGQDEESGGTTDTGGSGDISDPVNETDVGADGGASASPDAGGQGQETDGLPDNASDMGSNQENAEPETDDNDGSSDILDIIEWWLDSDEGGARDE